jgi:hypothetical protein
MAWREMGVMSTNRIPLFSVSSFFMVLNNYICSEIDFLGLFLPKGVIPQSGMETTKTYCGRFPEN